MYIILITLIFFIESILLLKIIRLEKYYSFYLVSLIFPFIYTNSFLIDFYLFGLSEIYLFSMNERMQINSIEYFLISMINLSFILGFYVTYLITNSKNEIVIRYSFTNDEFKYNFIKKIFFLIFTFCILFLLIINLGESRLEVKKFYVEHKYFGFLLQISFFYILFSSLTFFKTNFLKILFFLLLFSLFVQEREFIAISLYALLIVLKPKISPKLLLFFFVIILILIFYKNFTYFLNSLFSDQNLSFNHILNIKNMGLTFAEPISFLLQFKYYLTSPNNIYDEFYSYSYLLNTLAQFLKSMKLIFWDSISQFSTENFTKNKMGLGTFIFIEAFTNFSFFGPLILGIVFCILANSIEKLSGQNNNLYKIFSTIMFVFVLKFVRSELAVVLKLYILPMIISYILIYYDHLLKRMNILFLAKKIK